MLSFRTLILLLAGTYQSLSGQISIDLQRIEKGLSDFGQYEKIYLHINQDRYFAGDEIFGQLYLRGGLSGEPGGSRVAYVDLISPRDSILVSMTIKMNNGLGGLNIQLSSMWPQGKYRLRAYTNFMRNHSDDFFFEKEILISNPNLSEVMQSPHSTGNQDAYPVRFFPEGGHLVVGLPSQVAIEAVDENGRGLATEVMIMDQQGSDKVQYERIVEDLECSL